MMENYLKDPNLWEQKARAFVVRSHRHLWGKNNEDPQIFLYQQDLNNQFVKDLYIGWNKHGQERTLEKWGLDGKEMENRNNEQQTDTFILPPGIVFPYIVEKKLLAVWIHPLDPMGSPFILPGSAKDPIRLGSQLYPTTVVHRLFDGLRLFQEKKDTLCVEIRT